MDKENMYRISIVTNAALKCYDVPMRIHDNRGQKVKAHAGVTNDTI